MIEKISYRELFNLTDKIYSMRIDYDVKMNKYFIRYISNKGFFYTIHCYIIYYFNAEGVMEPLIELKSDSYFGNYVKSDSRFELILEFMNELKSFERKFKIDKLLNK